MGATQDLLYKVSTNKLEFTGKIGKERPYQTKVTLNEVKFFSQQEENGRELAITRDTGVVVGEARELGRGHGIV